MNDFNTYYYSKIMSVIYKCIYFLAQIIQVKFSLAPPLPTQIYTNVSLL